MRKIPIVLAILLSLSGCGGSSNDNTNNEAPEAPKSDAEKIIELENSGLIPKLDRSDSLLGPDTNNNGIRDDIDAFIESTYATAPKRSAAAQTARAYQEVFTLDMSDPIAVKNVVRKGSKANACVYQRFSLDEYPGQVSEQIVSITFNTKERFAVYMDYNRALSGTAWSLAKSEGACDE